MKDLEHGGDGGIWLWLRSPYCEAGSCVEVAGPWTKSSRSGAAGCVEARRPEAGTVLVRDSKLGDDSPVLSFDAGSWTEFVDGLKGGRS